MSTISIRPCPTFMDKKPDEAKKILEEEFISLGASGNATQRSVLEQIKCLNVEKVQKIFSLLTLVVRPSTENEETHVDELQKKINKRIKDDVRPIEIIAAMLLKGYKALFFGGVHQNLDYWKFEAELIIKVAPMMLAKLKENLVKYEGLVSDYPEHVINSISQRHFEISTKKVIGNSIAYIFYTKKENKCKILKDKTSKVYEPLILLLDHAQTNVSPIVILASNGIWEDIRPSCSERFSKHVSTFLAPYCIRTEQVYTKQLVGPYSSADVLQRAPLALDMDQRGVTCHSFTVTFSSWEDVEGKETRIKFLDEGIRIDKKLSLEDYEKIARNFVYYDQQIEHEKGPTHEWGMQQLPKELVQVVDEKIVNDLNEAAANYLAGDVAKVGDYEFDLDLTDDIRFSAIKFKVIVISHRYDDSFVDLPFENCDPELSLQEIGSAIRRYQNDGGNLFHSPGRWLFHLKMGNITLRYKVGELSYEKPLLECLQGRMVMPDGTVYFRTTGRWYHYNKSYYSELEGIAAQLTPNFLGTNESGFLSIPWDRKFIGEENYSKQYLTVEHQKAWFDGNKKRINEVEICDIMLASEEATYLYHLKISGLVPGDPNIGTSLRVIASQLVNSAQIIRAEIDRGINEQSELFRYCDRIKGLRESPLEAFRKKKIVFVLSIPFAAGDPLAVLLNSRSTIAKTEIIRIKKKIEDLGFGFKIAPISVL